ncbi:MAG: GTP cyclohydrolase II [Enterococcus lemanii]|jgi:3,4-dihydroxy 2-butanone 4-phosphate synthase/GTP cyclohydrolase II
MNKVEKALEWLKKGGLIIVADDENREAEGDLIGLAEFVTPEAVNEMTKLGRGLICAPISQAIAARFDLNEMTEKNTDAFGTAFTISVDHIETSTGISAFDRAKTIKKLADPNSSSADFYKPGHMFPLIAKDGGVLERRGHTEAAIDLAKLAGAKEVAYICEILKGDGTMARFSDLEKFAQEWELPLITIEDLTNYLIKKQAVTVALPTQIGDFQLTLFEDAQQKEHLMLSKGEIKAFQEPVLVRLHSECLTGDIFGSKRCDCGEQLHQAIERIEEVGQGVILYLRQEGRGIGLRNKLRAYQLQETGCDTYEANVALGFAPDERDYTFAADMLQAMGITRIKLMTNNPEKVKELEQLGIEVVERISLEIPPVKENQAYLKTKKEKFHHDLHLAK